MERETRLIYTQCARLPSCLAGNLARKLTTRGNRIAAIAGIEQGSIPAILIFAVVRICFEKIAGIAMIAGVVHSDPNDRNDYMETRL